MASLSTSLPYLLFLVLLLKAVESRKALANDENALIEDASSGAPSLDDYLTITIPPSESPAESPANDLDVASILGEYEDFAPSKPDSSYYHRRPFDVSGQKRLIPIVDLSAYDIEIISNKRKGGKKVKRTRSFSMEDYSVDAAHEAQKPEKARMVPIGPQVDNLDVTFLNDYEEPIVDQLKMTETLD